MNSNAFLRRTHEASVFCCYERVYPVSGMDDLVFDCDGTVLPDVSPERNCFRNQSGELVGFDIWNRRKPSHGRSSAPGREEKIDEVRRENFPRNLGALAAVSPLRG